MKYPQKEVNIEKITTGVDTKSSSAYDVINPNIKKRRILHDRVNNTTSLLTLDISPFNKAMSTPSEV
jgi:hypothetical protein